MTDAVNNHSGQSLVSLQTLRDEWTNTLRALSRINPAAPDVVANFRVQAVDGNNVFLTTDNREFFCMLCDPGKVKVVEKALFEVHSQRLYIKVAYTGDPAALKAPSMGDFVALTINFDGTFGVAPSAIISGDALCDLLEAVAGQIRQIRSATPSPF